MKRLIKSVATLALVAVASGTMVASLAGTTAAATPPPWETGSPPAVSPNEVGGLTFYNSSGQVITGGNIADKPIAAYIQGSTALQTSPTVADLDGYTPTQNGVPVSAPGNWNDFSFGSSNLPSSAPGALGSSTLPVYTGQSYSLSQLTTAFPNTDTSTTDGYAGLYVLRLRTYHHPNTSTTYDAADISVNTSNGTWSLVYSPQASTSTVLAVSPPSPQVSGTSVTLTATIADASAPGSVQFLNGNQNLGSPVAVVNGTASLITTSLPVGNPDNLSAVFTPAIGAAFAGSTSNTVPYVVTAPLPWVTNVSPSSGPPAGGTSVTITGTNLTGASAVHFGTTAATGVVVNSATSVSATSPAGSAGTVDVTVTTPGGTSATSSADQFTYVGVAGGTVTLKKSTLLIGNYPEAVSGTGWAAHGDTTVTLNECASTAYSATTCDAANRVSVPLGTGKLAGIFKNQLITLAVGHIDTAGDTCGVAGSTTCYIVVVGNTGDSTASVALGFKAPVMAAGKTVNALGNYLDGIKAAGFPIGDPVVAQECDGTVSVPTTVSTHCDSATQISGTANGSGGVAFSPTGVTLKVAGAYSDTAGGLCSTGGTCTLVVTDSNNSAIGLSVSVSFATPLGVVKKTTNVLGNYVDGAAVAGFPIGDSLVAQECDPSVVIPTNLSSHCDAATQVTATAGASGKAAFSPGLTMRVGGAYADGASGTCPPGGSCEVVISDSANPSVGVEVAVAFATPTATVSATSNVKANQLEKVTAGSFPIGDTVTATECDSAVTAANQATHCDASTQISGPVGASGKVTFTPTAVTVLVGSSYSDGAGGTCPAGGSCDIVVNDSTHSGAFIAIPIGLAP